MNYVVYFDCTDLNPDVIQHAKEMNQEITAISVTNDDRLRIEFNGHRMFERDMFIAELNANKSSTYFDCYEQKYSHCTVREYN